MATREEGATALEYMTMLLLAGLFVAGLATSGLVSRAGATIETAVCSLFSGQDCGQAGPTDPGGDAEREAALIAAERRRAPFIAEYGGRFAELAREAEAARRRGDYETAERIGRQLDLWAALIQSGDRGALLAALSGTDDASFDQLVAQETIYGDDDSATRYFRVEPVPGDGIVVFDFFIREANSGPLAGDDRDFADPLRGGHSPDDSRMIVIIDRETGRGMVRVSGSCTVSAFGQRFCNEARPISFDDEFLVNDPDHDITGEGVNLDTPNRFDFESDGESIRVRYDALNSITPLVISVDGDMELRRRSDGTYELVHNDRDNYPAIGIYQYLPDGRYVVIDEDPGQGVIPGALPHCDLPDLPDLPGPLPDLPDLPSVPGPC